MDMQCVLHFTYKVGFDHIFCSTSFLRLVRNTQLNHYQNYVVLLVGHVPRSIYLLHSM